MHKKNIITAGLEPSDAEKALIMLHGRGATAQDILSLAEYLNVGRFTIFVPQATNLSWYPYSFLVPTSQNEPWLSSALDLVDSTVNNLISMGIVKEKLYFLGFSQGACLALEYTARNAEKYGGIAAFTGGLIGDKIHIASYSGNFERTPVFIGTSNPDPHVPVDRVQATNEVFHRMNADVTLKIFNDMGHTVSEDEINMVNSLIFKPDAA